MARLDRDVRLTVHETKIKGRAKQMPAEVLIDHVDLMLPAAGVQRVAEARVLGAIDVGRGPIGDIAADADGATIVATDLADARSPSWTPT